MMENPADFYYGVLWNKLYRRDIVEEHHLRMDPEVSWCEDFLFNLEYILHAERFCALQVPIYYYVKTKGSLANQSMTISRTVKTKLTLFEYYNQFYKRVLDPAEYEKNRLKVYRFLFDAAQDGAVPPPIMPGSRRLGDERVSVSFGAASGSGVLQDGYLDRKLMIHYLEQFGIYVSSGSACAKGERSHVLTAMGLSHDRIDSAVRVSMTDTTTAGEIDEFCRRLLEGEATLTKRR